jgi:type IV secretory pathway component VirB8
MKKDAISGLQERKRAYKRRQRAFLWEVAIGALTAAVVLAVAVKVMLLLTK